MKRVTATLAMLTLAGTLAAQEPHTIHLEVTAVSGRSIYVDVGRSDGLTPGVEIELLPAGAPTFRVSIREVSSHSARAEVPLGFDLPPVGTPGQAEVRLGGDAGSDPRRAADPPNHPPWTAQGLGGADPDAPLLAPAFGGGPASRPTSWRGRVFAQLLATHDGGEGRGVDTLRARLGTRMQVLNPFGAGGRLAFDGEFTRRSIDSFFGDDSDDRGRIDQLSYTWGDDEVEPWRIEFGRFVSSHAPQLGLLDGVEAVRRLDREWSVGAGIGLAPEPFPDRASGDDVGVHVFTTWHAPGDIHAAATVGLQKTWHHGSADRDLLFSRFDWSPADGVRLDGSVKLDFYTGSDTLESSAMEVTDAWLAANWRANPTVDLGLNVSSHRWPQLQRGDYAFLPVALIQHGHVERISPRVAVRVTDDIRVTARIDAWQDQEHTGTGGELGADLTNLFDRGISAGVSLFYSDGSWQSGPGVRGRLRSNFDWGSAGLRAEWMSYDTQALVTGTESFDLLRTGLDVDLDLGDRWNLMLDAELVSGDQENGYFLGMFAQRRF